MRILKDETPELVNNMMEGMAT